jgi:hypothetical protein
MENELTNYGTPPTCFDTTVLKKKYIYIQGDAGRRVNILAGESIGHCGGRGKII